MVTGFRIGVNTEPEILATPPPQFRHLNLLYTPFAVHVGAFDFPASCWCDFAGVLLLRWCREVWKLSRGETRAARLGFWYTYEVWLRKTTKHWWMATCV